MDEIHKLNIPDTEFFLAGGSVRDLLLGREPHDKDYVVICPYSFKGLVTILRKKGAEIYQAKEEFLTIRCKIGKDVVDIAYPRKDGDYSDGRHPDKVEVAQTLEEDSNRRDFTCNSLYMDGEGNILDFHKGQEDIKEGIIRCVGNPEDRIHEDHLRAFRAVRFCCQLGFNMEPETKQAVRRTFCNSFTIKGINSERIREEVQKALKADAYCFFRLIAKLGMRNIMKGVEEKGLRFEVTAKR